MPVYVVPPGRYAKWKAVYPGSAPAGSASFTITVPENDLFAETTLHFTVEIAEKPALDLSGMTTAYTYSLKGAESIQYSKVITDEVQAAYPGATVGFNADPSALNYGPAKPVGDETYTVTVSNVAGHKEGSFEVTITVVDDRDELSVDDFTFTHPYKKTSTAYPVAVDGAAVTVTTTPLPAGISWRADNSTLYVNSDAKVGEYTLDATASKSGMKDASFRIIVTVTDERQELTILLDGGAVTAEGLRAVAGGKPDQSDDRADGDRRRRKGPLQQRWKNHHDLRGRRRGHDLYGPCEDHPDRRRREGL